MYDDIDFKPPAGAANAAKKAIDWKEEHGDSVQGGTQVGWTRASQLVKGDPLSPETVRRMYKFFQRHEKNKAVKPEYRDEPWRDNGYVAWLIWGGDAGKSWAETKWRQMEKADGKTASRITRRMASGSPLRERPDYGEKEAVNSYLNTPPTRLKRQLDSEKDPGKRKQMTDALNAWRATAPGPFWRSQSASGRRISKPTKGTAMNRTSMNREQVAREILKVARELTAKDLLTFANVNADKHLKKEAQQALRGFESVRDSIKWYQDGEWSADDAKGSIWALIDDLEKVEKTCALVRRTMKMLMEEINKKEELRREDAKR